MTSSDTESGLPLRNLILVPGHAVYISPEFDNPQADSAWSLEEFQRGEPPLLMEHISAAVRLARRSLVSLLIFSGGCTCPQAGPVSEAFGYRRLAERHEEWTDEVDNRCFIEEYATDSFQNLLFGLCRYYEVLQRWPESVRVLGWGFKKARYEAHSSAIRWPPQRFSYTSVNNPVRLAEAREGEGRVRRLFQQDPYGTGAVLAAKRARRNPFELNPPYAVTCPAVAALLDHQGPDLFAGDLPWR